jgi:aconitate hydratase 2/2-methylisocitrate dehydratase
MGNQARVADGTTVVSTSTRNFPNRMGDNTSVYLASAELAAITARSGVFPTLQKYRDEMKKVAAKADSIYRYLYFDKIDRYAE